MDTGNGGDPWQTGNGGGNGYGSYGGAGGGTYQGFQSSIVLEPEEIHRLQEIRAELQNLDRNVFKHAFHLLQKEAEKIETRMDPDYLEVDIPKPIKVVRKILVPTHRFPKFNFVGKILGPGGKTLQAMAKQFKCHIYVLGRGSTKDRAKEEELYNSGDPKHSHYSLPLHVKIETECPPPLAYQRVTAVVTQMQQILQPVRDELVASQMEELGYEFNPSLAGGGGRGGGPPGRGGPMRGAPRGGGGDRGRGGPPRGRGMPPPPMRGGVGGGRGRGAPGAGDSYSNFFQGQYTDFTDYSGGERQSPESHPFTCDRYRSMVGPRRD